MPITTDERKMQKQQKKNEQRQKIAGEQKL